jgi:hypothetical protein
MTTKECIICHGGGDLQPLYLDGVAGAQPAAWVHKACLSGEETEADREAAEAFKNLRQWPSKLLKEIRKRGE